ncbi:MAG: glycosyltransferase [Chloroflexi bacterium]|nr:glycosyltransferase [Chloroflexota bacterium]
MRTDEPRVSVIIPTYNRAGYLALALRSIARQSLRPAEVIVVDDGSTDDTQNVVRASGLDVRYLRQNHEGVAAARNRGVRAATGDLIAWLDSDDLWEPSFLATLVPLLTANDGWDGVYCGASTIDAAGDPLPQVQDRVAPPEQLYDALLEGNFIMTPALVLRKRCLAKAGPFAALPTCEDYDMWLRLARAGALVGVRDILIKCRVHGGNTIGNLALFRQSLLTMMANHFGPAEGDAEEWSPDKRRAYGFAYRSAALTYLQEGADDRALALLSAAVHTWPPLLARLDTSYELAVGGQERSHRGQAARLDLRANRARMLAWLDGLYASPAAALAPYRRKAYGHAYLALAMLYDQAGEWAAARQCLLRALRADPDLVRSPAVARRLLKLLVGKRAAALARGTVRWMRGALVAGRAPGREA